MVIKSILNMYSDFKQILLIHKKAIYCEIHSKQCDRQLNPDLFGKLKFKEDTRY